MASERVGDALPRDDLAGNHGLREAAHPHALPDRAVQPVQLGQPGLGPVLARLLPRYLHDLFADGLQDALVVVVGEHVQEGVAARYDGGVDGSEIQGQDPRSDLARLQFVRPAFRLGYGDVPGDIVVGWLPVLESRIASLLGFHVREASFYQWDAVLCRLPVVELASKADFNVPWSVFLRRVVFI